MATITVNISLPTRLKQKADELVAMGDFASFSDFARSSMRQLIRDRRYNELYEEAKLDVALGRTKELKNTKEIKDFINKHME